MFDIHRLIALRSYCAAGATGNAGWVGILYFDVMVSAASAAWFWLEARWSTRPDHENES